MDDRPDSDFIGWPCQTKATIASTQRMHERPLADAVILPALYAPIIAMLIRLIFRDVAFEFRWRTTRWKAAWDVSFFAGSLFAALSQGTILGA